jgi:hypothetical protein
MGRLEFILALSILISGLMSGCGCLAADAYSKTACQKYHTHYDLDSIYWEN